MGVLINELRNTITKFFNKFSRLSIASTLAIFITQAKHFADFFCMHISRMSMQNIRGKEKASKKTKKEYDLVHFCLEEKMELFDCKSISLSFCISAFFKVNCI